MYELLFDEAVGTVWPLLAEPAASAGEYSIDCWPDFTGLPSTPAVRVENIWQHSGRVAA